VVAKDAVVKEEVVVRKTSDERVEDIDETVRRTEVDVDDTRKSGKGTSSGKRTRR
jgi:stress response protein YsnF